MKRMPLLLGMLVLFGVAAGPLFAAGERWALLIGVDKCKALGELKVCAADVRALQALLPRVGYATDHILVLADDTADLSNWPTFGNVQRTVQRIANIAEPDDSIMMFFSGHGVSRDNEGYLVPSDGDAKQAVPLAWVKDQLRASKAKEKLLILDACHSGSAKGVSGIAPSLQETPDLVMLLSCDRDQVSWPDESTGRSVFTSALLDGLGGKAAGADRLVTATRLHEYVRARVKTWTFKNNKDLQSPLLVGTPDEKLVLAACPPNDLVVASARSAKAPAKDPVAARPAPAAVAPPSAPAAAAATAAAAVAKPAALAPAPTPTQLAMANKIVVPARAGGATAPAAGKDWTVPETGMEFVWIPAMKMWVGKYEVTNGEYRKHKANYDSRDYNGLSLNGDRQPVVYVNFDDANEYAVWLTQREQAAGRLPVEWRYRLPTKDEWTAFAQCGDGREYPWGNEWPPKYGNYSDSASAWKDKIEGYTDGFAVTCPVEKSGRNDWGLHGVGGNVWENTAVSPGGARDALRGACWGASPQHLLRYDAAFSVGTAAASSRNPFVGFRLVLARDSGVTTAPAAVPTAPASGPGAGKVPAGFRAAPGTAAEPYTNTGWAKEIVHEKSGIKMVYIPAGSFMMGSPAAEKRGEEKQHRVTLTSGYYLGKYEVTQEQWQAVMGINPSFFKQVEKNTPVEQVRWTDCQAFCARLNALESRPATPGAFRLPTAAEWEYACRAGTAGAYAGYLDDMAWYDKNSGKTPHPVGQKKPNAWGLYDMHGNVTEWCADWHGEYPDGPVTDPVGPATGEVRTSRGGSWFQDAEPCRSAGRYGDYPHAGCNFYGMRLLKEVFPSSGKVPSGFRAAPGTAAEPYTNTGWAKEIVHEKTGIEMVYIPAGSFTMGSPASEEKEKHDNDETQHQVTLTRGFYLGKYEVTQEQWERVMGSNPADFKRVGKNAPVEKVSWTDCQEYVGKLNALIPAASTFHPPPSSLGTFRLPTEAEWEYACRAGTATPFHYGSSLDASMANFDGNYPYGSGGKDVYRRATVPVGQFQANAWGLYDMHGNVWEWCADWYGAYPAGSVTDPTGPGSNSCIVVRGGCWNYWAMSCRSASRHWADPGDRYYYLGLRLVRTVSP